MTALPARTGVSDTYPKPTNKQAKEALGQMWDVLAEISEKPEVEIASAATCDIGGQSSTKLRITGTTTITSFGTNYRGPIQLRMAGALTITHNSTTLICPDAADLTTISGDILLACPKATAGVSDGWQIARFSQSKATYADLGVVNIKDYGAKGDGGVTNNFQAITDAMAAANGRKILVPLDSAGGDYAVTSGSLTLTGVFEYEAGARIYASGSSTVTDNSRFMGFGGGGIEEQGRNRGTFGLNVQILKPVTESIGVPDVMYNFFNIPDDQVRLTTGSPPKKVHGLFVDHRFGGSSATGGRHGFMARILQNAPTDPANPDRNYVGAVGQIRTSVGDGGTPGAEKGAYFGGNFFAAIDTGALDTLNATACEFNAGIYAGGSSKYRTGIQIAMFGDERGGSIDAGIAIYNLLQATTTLKDGILIGPFDGIKDVLGVDSNAITVSQAGSILNALRFSVPISGSLLEWTPGDGSNILIRPNTANFNRPNYGLELGRVGVANGPYIDFHSSAFSPDYDTRISSSGGTSVSGGGTLTYTAAIHSFVGGMRFGTFTTGAATASGYIEITDATGRVTKLLAA